MGNYQFHSKTAEAIFKSLPKNIGADDWGLKKLNDPTGGPVTYCQNRIIMVTNAILNSRLPQGLQDLAKQQLTAAFDVLKAYVAMRAVGVGKLGGRPLPSPPPLARQGKVGAISKGGPAVDKTASGAAGPALETQAEALANSASKLDLVCRDVAQRDEQVGKIFEQVCLAFWKLAQGAAVEVEAKSLGQPPTDVLLRTMKQPFEPAKYPWRVRPSDAPDIGGQRASGPPDLPTGQGGAVEPDPSHSIDPNPADQGTSAADRPGLEK
jgi:hypothetical protein